MQSAFAAAAAASAHPNEAPWAVSYQQAEGVAPRRMGPVVNFSKQEGGSSPNTAFAAHINNLWQAAAAAGDYASDDGGWAEEEEQEQEEEEEEQQHRGKNSSKKAPGTKGSKQAVKKRTTGKGGPDSNSAHKEQRMMKNRESAARSRLRRQQHIQGLEEDKAALRAELDDARQQVGALKGKVADLEWWLQMACGSPDDAPAANRRHSVATGGPPTISGLPAAPSLSNLSLPPLSTLIEQAMALPAGLLQGVLQGMHAEQGDEGESGGLGQQLLLQAHGGGQCARAFKHERQQDEEDGDDEGEEEEAVQPPSKRQRHHHKPPRPPGFSSAAAPPALAAAAATPTMSAGLAGLALLEACEARAPSLGLGQSLRMDSIGSLDGLVAPAALAQFFAEASRRGSSDA